MEGFKQHFAIYYMRNNSVLKKSLTLINAQEMRTRHPKKLSGILFGAIIKREVLF